MGFLKKIDKNKLLYSGLIFTFIILYGATAFVSWYHSITFFNISNETWLSVLLSFVAEVGQASVLFSILLTANKNKILPWAIMIILTSLQVIGNVVSTYKYIVTSNTEDFLYFQNSILFWVETGSPELFKVIIAWISGALLPIIALSMTSLVAQNMKLKEEETNKTDQNLNSNELKTESGNVGLSDEDLIKLNEILEKYKPTTKEEIVERIKTEEGVIENEVLSDNSNQSIDKIDNIKVDDIKENIEINRFVESSNKIEKEYIDEKLNNQSSSVEIEELNNQENIIENDIVEDIKENVEVIKEPELPIPETVENVIVDDVQDQQNIKKKYPKIPKSK